MLLFVFTLILMFSLSAVLYLMVKALPRVAEETNNEKKGILERWAGSEIPEKIDESLNGFLLKFLRKFKVFVLKLDNAISAHLRKIHHEGTEKKSNIDFKEINESKDKEEEVKS